MAHRSTREVFGRLAGAKGKKGQFYSGIYVGEMLKIDTNSQRYQSLFTDLLLGRCPAFH